MSKDALASLHKKIAALLLLAKGQVTLSEAARLCGTSRQRVSHWAKDLDVKGARDRWLAKVWAAEIRKLGKS